MNKYAIYVFIASNSSVQYLFFRIIFIYIKSI